LPKIIIINYPLFKNGSAEVRILCWMPFLMQPYNINCGGLTD
jgi:hypothetical protein